MVRHVQGAGGCREPGGQRYDVDAGCNVRRSGRSRNTADVDVGEEDRAGARVAVIERMPSGGPMR